MRCIQAVDHLNKGLVQQISDLMAASSQDPAAFGAAAKAAGTATAQLSELVVAGAAHVEDPRAYFFFFSVIIF